MFGIVFLENSGFFIIYKIVGPLIAEMFSFYEFFGRSNVIFAYFLST